MVVLWKFEIKAAEFDWKRERKIVTRQTRSQMRKRRKRMKLDIKLV